VGLLLFKTTLLLLLLLLLFPLDDRCLLLGMDTLSCFEKLKQSNKQQTSKIITTTTTTTTTTTIKPSQCQAELQMIHSTSKPLSFLQQYNNQRIVTTNNANNNENNNGNNNDNNANLVSSWEKHYQRYR
jgi:predicted outer membrane protein